MGFEGRRKPPDFIIKAAMAEDPSVLRQIQSRGGKAAAAKRAERKQRAANRESKQLSAAEKEQQRLKEEREILDLEAERIVRRDAFAHEKAFPALED